MKQTSTNCDLVESDPLPASPFQGEEEFGAGLPPLSKGRAEEGINDAQVYQARLKLIAKRSRLFPYFGPRS